MTICYCCQKPHEITETLTAKKLSQPEHSYEVCLDCLRKVQRAQKELDLPLSMAIQVIAYFFEEQGKQ